MNSLKLTLSFSVLISLIVLSHCPTTPPEPGTESPTCLIEGADPVSCQCTAEYVLNQGKNRCLQKMNGSEPCEDSVQCHHLGDFVCRYFGERKVCMESPIRCTGTDQYGQDWEGVYEPSSNPPGYTRGPCPFGVDIWRLAVWNCTSNGKFSGLPSFESCETEWVNDLVSEIQKAKEIPYETALPFANGILANVTAAAKDGGVDSNYFGHEMNKLLNSMQSLAFKYVPLPAGILNLELPELVLKTVAVMLEYRKPWQDLKQDGKDKTFSSILKTIEGVVLTVGEKGCLSKDVKSTDSKCPFPHAFETLDVELGGLIPESNVAFPASGTYIKGQDSFLKVSILKDGGRMYVGSSIPIEHVLEYANHKLKPLKSKPKKPTRVHRSASDGKSCDSADTFEGNGDLLSFTSFDSSWTSSLHLKDPIAITLLHDKYAWGSEVMEIRRGLHASERPTAVQGSGQCVFWDHSLRMWSSEGCEVLETSSFSTTCYCNHLSAFTIMMHFHSYIGKSKGVIGLTITSLLISLFYLLWKLFVTKRTELCGDSGGDHRLQITKTYSFILTFGTYGVVFFLADKHFYLFNPGMCYRIGIVGHFILLMDVILMTLEFFIATVDYIGIKQFEGVLRFANSKPHIMFLGVPGVGALVVVLTTVTVDVFDGPNSRAYGGEFCWLDGPFIYSLFGPMWFLLGLNFIFFGLLIRQFVNVFFIQKKSAVKTLSGRVVGMKELMSFLKEGILTNTLVLVTWLLGFFSMGPKYQSSTIISWIFPILLFLQGCLMEKLVDKQGFLEWLKKKSVDILIAICVSKPNEDNSNDSASPMELQDGMENMPMLSDTHITIGETNRNSEMKERKIESKVGHMAKMLDETVAKMGKEDLPKNKDWKQIL